MIGRGELSLTAPRLKPRPPKTEGLEVEALAGGVYLFTQESCHGCLSGLFGTPILKSP